MIPREEIEAGDGSIVLDFSLRTLFVTWVIGPMFMTFPHELIFSIVTGQLWSVSTTTLQCRLRMQLNSILFAKTLVRKDVASSGSSNSESKDDDKKDDDKKNDDENDFSSKAQVMTLMTTDVDRVSDFSWHIFSLFGRLLLYFFFNIFFLI